MTTTPDLTPQVTALLQDAAEWRLLGRLLECPSPAWIDDLDLLGRQVSDESLADLAREARREASEGLYHSIFGPGGPAPPREATYQRSLELGSLMADLTDHYDAFGYAPDTPEAPDHVAIEAGFVAYLRLKEAYAHAMGDDEAAGVTRRAASRFTSQHLATMAEPLAGLLAESGVDYLARASALLAARVGPPPSSKQLPVIQPDAFSEDDDGEMACDLP
jgi:nitrate reductase assembly molybdenum cofactor insertion protein NarJ